MSYSEEKQQNICCQLTLVPQFSIVIYYPIESKLDHQLATHAKRRFRATDKQQEKNSEIAFQWEK